jgi:class 3 adenylate cyclase/predicted ATPase
MSFCGQCGARLSMTCPNCGFENPFDYRFCGKCGSRLGSPLAPVALPSPQLVPGLARPAVEAAHGYQEAHAVPAPPAAATEADTVAVVPLAGERRIATVILADVYHSTDLMEQLGTEAWVELMNQALQLLAAEVYRFGGRVDQFRGDGLVAFFGATAAHEDDPERAIMAALAMHEAIRSCADELAQQRNVDLTVRVGVNTGEVIVAGVGEASQHREDTAMGGGVALAARMETAAEPGTVLVSGDTYRLVKDRFEWQPLGDITVKGISKPVAVYRPLRLRTPTESRQANDLALPLVAEHSVPLEALRGCVEGLRNGRGGIALVTGEKGMGKSALVSYVRQHCEQEGGGAVSWLFFHSRSYDQSTPYAIWIGLLHSWLEAAATESEPDWAALLHRQAELLWGDQVERYLPYLATLLSLPVEGALARRIAYLRAEGLQKQLSEALYGWAEALAQRRPLVLALGDLQFADASSLELLKTCLPICESAPVLWIASFRPDRTSPVWEFRHHVETEYPHRLTSIDLPPLTESESRGLIGQMLGQGVLTDATVAFVVEKAEGNPYYVREIVYALIDQGLVQRDSAGAWRQTQPIHSFNLPGSLYGLLLARIDHLSAEERRVLQIASVIGPFFWRNVLEAMVDDAGQLQASLTQLQRGQLIHEQSLESDLGMGYVFTPSLVREVAYESLLSAQRTAFHRRVAEQLEAILDPDSSNPYHGLLAYQYHQAGDLNKELYHAIGAAAEARRVYANSDALAHYTRILALLDRIEDGEVAEDQRRALRERRFEALNGRHEVENRMGNIEAGRADAYALLPLAQQMGDNPVFMVDALLAQPAVNYPNTHDELTAGLKMAQEALSLTQQAGDKRREMRALLAVGNLQQLLKDPAWREFGAQALELSRQLGDLRTEVGLLLGIGGSYGMDNLERSSEYLQAALSISQRLEDKETEAWLLAALSPEHERRGDYYRQLTEFERKRVEIYREVGNRIGEVHALVSCGKIEAIYLGDYQGGLRLIQEALEWRSEMPDRLFAWLRVVQIQAALGQFDAAWAMLEQARAVIERVIKDIGRAGLILAETILHNAQGGVEAAPIAASLHWREALDLQAQVRQMVAEGQVSRQYQMAAACETAAAHLGLAGCVEDAAERTEHLRSALEASGTALDIYKQFGFTQIVECSGEEIMYRHSLALAANGRLEESGEMLEAANTEMLRKHDLIPDGSPFRKTFLENIALHRQIRAAHEAATTTRTT